MPIVTRFAPSPTGYLHIGHAFSALFAWRAARQRAGRFLLRIEDIDRGRWRAEFEEAIYQDLAWLGLDWETPVRRQSEHMDDYASALARLTDQGLVYPCFCTRAEIRAEIGRAGAAPHGPDGALYPGTCRGLAAEEVLRRRAAGDAFAFRLDVARALRLTGELSWRDTNLGVVTADPEALGDIVLARKDIPTSYHLSVVVDDALQGVSLVTRGEDLIPATDIHRLLQALLDLPVPDYHHHGLLSGDDGNRLAKRDRALTLRALREAGHAPAEVRRMAGLSDLC